MFGEKLKRFNSKKYILQKTMGKYGKFLGRCMFAAYFIITGWYGMKNKTAGAQAMADKYKSTLTNVETRFGVKTPEFMTHEKIEKNQSVLFSLGAIGYVA